ncbi:MAG: gliding motility-associated ABC transporter substrate-binding protein GldG [Chitinophagaceae bacterium]|nr:MAG: gliding motility-associated ABC transporter substrate-binding protein GldG [Chitinophagaceae bacterium]
MEQKKRIRGASKYGWLGLLLLLVVINFLSSMLHTRFDLTREKRYTLSKATNDLLRKLDEPLEIDVFLEGEFPAGFRKLANSTGDFLRLLKERNGSNIRYRFINPTETMPGSARSYGDSLVNLGATPINLTVQVKSGESSNIIFPVAVVRYKGKQSLVNIYSGASGRISQEEINSSEATMEYEFAKTIDRLTDDQKPIIAYSTGNGEPMDARTYGIQEALHNDYRLALLNLNNQPLLADTFKVLLMVKPAVGYSEEEKLKIDQYVMHGGKVLMFVDDLIAEQDSLRFQTQTIAFDRNLNLTDLLFRYGARINPSLVMDLQCDFLPFAVGGTTGTPQYEFLRWNYYPLFESRGNHPINKNLGLISGKFVNSIDTIAAPGIRKTVLLGSSANSRIISTPALISLNENRNVQEDALYRSDNIPVAVLLEGKFTSLYRNRVTQAQTQALVSSGVEFKAGSEDNKMILVGDGDIVLNDVSAKQGPLPLGVNLFTVGSQYEYKFANRDFLLNCLEYLVNKPSIVETRNKNIVLRLLDKRKVDDNKLTWQLINIALPVLLVILAGFIYQRIRRNKYAS